MTPRYFSDLYEYDSKMNLEVLSQLRGSQAKLAKGKRIFGHLLAAKQVWIRRLKGQNPKGISIWPEFSYCRAEQWIGRNIEDYQGYLSSLSKEGLKRDLAYENSKGRKFETPVRDILTHVLIHGGYHRGQIAKYVRRAGEEPLNTDYITYVRNS